MTSDKLCTVRNEHASEALQGYNMEKLVSLSDIHTSGVLNIKSKKLNISKFFCDTRQALQGYWKHALEVL